MKKRIIVASLAAILAASFLAGFVAGRLTTTAPEAALRSGEGASLSLQPSQPSREPGREAAGGEPAGRQDPAEKQRFFREYSWFPGQQPPPLWVNLGNTWVQTQYVARPAKVGAELRLGPLTVPGGIGSVRIRFRSGMDPFFSVWLSRDGRTWDCIRESTKSDCDITCALHREVETLYVAIRAERLAKGESAEQLGGISRLTIDLNPEAPREAPL